ncbi:MAG: hypothetical protein QOJ63_3535 [Solirubrobacteraceae bacterium]|nr:hypothetical protein [Solirubrobacteraceae bacterium]
MYRRPQRTLLSGIGVASAVLAGVLIAYAVAVGMIGYRFAPGEPPIPPPVAMRTLDRPEPAPRLQPRRAREPAPAPAPTAPTVRSFVAAPVLVAVAPTSHSRVQPRPTPPPPSPRPPSPRPPRPPAPPAPAPPAATARRASALAPLGAGVDRTTERLAVTLRTLTSDLGEAVKLVSPQISAVVVQTGGALGDVVAATGELVRKVLGHPAAP